MNNQTFLKSLRLFVPFVLYNFWICSQAFAAPIPISVPCNTQPVHRGPGNDSLQRFKGDGSNWSFTLQPEAGVTISNQVWTYPGKGQGTASQWGQWEGGDGTNELKWSSPQVAQPFTVKVKARRSCAGNGRLGNGEVSDSEFEVSWSGDVKDIVVEFSPTPIGICTIGQDATLTATVSPPEKAGEVTFDTLSPAVATVVGTAPNLTVTGVGAGQTKVRALDDNLSVIAVADINVEDNTTFSQTDVVIRQVPPSHSSIIEIGGRFGLTAMEDFNIEITACLEGDGTWHAIMTGISASYSIQIPNLWKWITGPNGAPPGTTTAANFCSQVQGLKQHGIGNPAGPPPYIPSEWYQSEPLRSHEEVHAAHIPSMVQQLAAFTEPAVEAIVVPNTPGMTQSQAINAMQAQLQSIRKIGFDSLIGRLNELSIADHGSTGAPGPALTTQYAAEEESATTICNYAANQNPAWPDCAACH